MPEFTLRIQRVTEELRHIFTELERAAHADADPAYRQRVSRSLLAPGVVKDFKTVIDDMRLILWSYMEADQKASSESIQNIEAKLQSVRMQRVTEMLRALEPDVHAPSTNQLPEAHTFFELIHNIANTTVDRHEGRSQ